MVWCVVWCVVCVVGVCVGGICGVFGIICGRFVWCFWVFYPKGKRADRDSNPGSADLQSAALPLGHPPWCDGALCAVGV